MSKPAGWDGKPAADFTITAATSRYRPGEQRPRRQQQDRLSSTGILSHAAGMSDIPEIPDIPSANDDQVKYWNSESSKKWVTAQETMDAALAASADAVIARADPQPGERVIDVGCGTGATSLLLAEQVGSSGSVMGVDISANMLALARTRAEAAGHANLRFELADAQVHDFEEAGADLLASRFGVMFFTDPVAAFVNLRQSLRPGGRMVFAAWAPLSENPWFHIPTAAAIARLGRPEPSPPRAPGPLAFSDRDYVLEILRESGFADFDVDVVTVHVTGLGNLEEVAARAVEVGPASRLVRELDGDENDKAAIIDTVRAEMAQYHNGECALVPATLHMLSGQRPG
jgi:SAM-dependent methyltransferase